MNFPHYYEATVKLLNQIHYYNHERIHKVSSNRAGHLVVNNAKGNTDLKPKGWDSNEGASFVQETINGLAQHEVTRRSHVGIRLFVNSP